MDAAITHMTGGTSLQELDEISMSDLIKRRGRFNVGPFLIYAGEQLQPHVEMVVGHSHEQPHMMVLLNPPLHECPHCKGALPVPKYELTIDGDDGAEIVRVFDPYGVAYVRAGRQHRIKQITPGALGGFACAFPRYDENGLIAEPMAEAEPDAEYTHG